VCAARVTPVLANVTDTLQKASCFLPSAAPPPHLDAIAIVVELRLRRFAPHGEVDQHEREPHPPRGRPAIRSSDRYHWPARGGIVPLRVLHAQDQASVPGISASSLSRNNPAKQTCTVPLGRRAHPAPDRRRTASHQKPAPSPCGRCSATAW
jgi:hypothetical protein